MKQCMKYIRTNPDFRKSVNLQLDLGNYERIGSYIPTRSSIAILNRYFAGIAGAVSENALILIGPYGKGKSHLLLVLLALLGGEEKQKSALLKKIRRADKESAEKIKQACVGKKYLPVLLNPVAGDDLNQTFIVAMREALIREGLEEIAPDSYYSEAVRVIENWREEFPGTYEAFLTVLGQKNSSVEKFMAALRHGERQALDVFMEEYPKLTAGSMFAPMLHMGALKLYQQMGRMLTEQYGYNGIFIVFDEFSKYIEGHSADGFSNDMKTLQDMCELANNSKQELFLTLVAHKSIREYAKGIPVAAKNAFRGVEGRLTEIEFVVSAQNNYELIADAIEKIEPEFSEAYSKLEEEASYCGYVTESWQLPCFQKLFTSKEFNETIAKGCFPLTPLFSYALLHISERIAQNERTIFTFLAAEGQGSLAWLIEREEAELIGIDKIYDYFKSLFRENVEQPKIHGEWLKAEYALEQTSDKRAQSVIKAIAIIQMIGRSEELPANQETIALALAMDKNICKGIIEELEKSGIIRYRSSEGGYYFRGNVGVDVEAEITKRMAVFENKDIVCETLSDVVERRYEIPRQYNQDYAMTRYFSYLYMKTSDFMRLTASKYLFEETFSDGKIIVLIPDEKAECEKLQSKLDEIADERLILLVSEEEFDIAPLLCRYVATKSLLEDTHFTEDNRVLVQELLLYRDDIVYEINEKMEKAYFDEFGHVWILRCGQQMEKGKGAVKFGSMLSTICEEYYSFSPKVNHELVNIQHVGTQYLKARNAVVKRLLEDESCESYLTGTSPECLVYRAAFVHTQDDRGCKRVFDEIDAFFRQCAGKRASFANLYERLSGKDYGVRKGIIPLFLAKKLADMDVTASIYVGKREMEVDYATLNKVNEQPESYELYLEQETAEKEQYLQILEKTFCVERTYTTSKQGRISKIVRCMQNWYRSLPQYTMVTNEFAEADVEEINVLRNHLKRAEVNPRELLLERLPEAMGVDSYKIAAKKMTSYKELLDGKLEELKSNLASEVKRVFGADKEASLKACLLDWYKKQSRSSKNYIMSTAVSNFMKYLGTLETNDEGDIVADISKIVMDVYLEDWRDGMLETYIEEIRQIKQKVEDIEDTGAGDNRSHIILKDADGNEIERYYENVQGDSTSMYLKNMLSEALEEFGDTLEANQKVAVLVEMLEELL